MKLTPTMVAPALAGLVVFGLAAAPPARAQSLGDRIFRGGLIAAQGLFITPQAEQQLGQATLAQILAKTPEISDPTIRSYVSSVGQRVAAKADRRDVPYSYRVVDSSEVNAFTLPGGFICITSSCLRLMTNEAQLASVLGHETGHAVRRDPVNGIRRVMLAQGLATAALGADPNQLEVVAANVGATLVLRGYGRQAEYAADQLGAKYAYLAGYDPRQLSSFLAVLARQSGEIPIWLLPVADHPRSLDRIQRLNGYVAQMRVTSKSVVGQTAYQRLVTSRLARMPRVAPRPNTATPNQQVPGQQAPTPQQPGNSGPVFAPGTHP